MSPRFSLTLELDWEGRLGVLVRNLRTMKVVWVNVSESSNANSQELLNSVVLLS